MDTKLSTNRKLKRMFANILSIVVILALAFPVTGSAFAQDELPQFSLYIRAYIDGYSQLVIQGSNVYWHHSGAAAPGRLDSANEPTYLNGTEWYPNWPVDGENRECNCDSSTFGELSPTLPEDQSFVLNVIRARWSAYISQQPTAGNDYTLVIDFDDGPPGGADWYEVELIPGESPAVQGEHWGSEGISHPNSCNAYGPVQDQNNPEREVQMQILSDGEVVANGESFTIPEGHFYYFNLWGLISNYQDHAIRAQAYDEETSQWVNLSYTPKLLNCVNYDIYVVNTRDGTAERLTMLDDYGEYNPSWSPDGKKIVHDVTNADFHALYITDVKTHESTPLSGADGGNDADWSPNGKWIVFDRSPYGDPSLYILPPTGGTPTLVMNNATNGDWSPDGQRLVFQYDNGIVTANIKGGDVKQIVEAGYSPVWSPNGMWIAYDLDGDIYKVRVNKNGARIGDPVQLTSGPASDGGATWSQDSKQIAFASDISSDHDIWQISAEGGSPVRLVRTNIYGDYDPGYNNTGQYIAYDGAKEPAQPYIVAFPEWGYIEGQDWPMNDVVHLTIDDPATEIKPDYEAEQPTVANDWGTWWVQFNFDYDLKIGDRVTETDGYLTRTYTVRNLTVTDANRLADFVTGNADPGAVVYVWAWGRDDSNLELLTAQDGTWIADYSTMEFDLEAGMCGRAEVRDKLGNRTAVDWCVPNPRIVASEAGDWFWMTEFNVGPLDLLLYESAAEDAPLLWSGNTEVTDTWGITSVGYDMHGQDMMPGNYLVVSDGVNRKGLVLETISVDVFDTENEIMAGTAPLGRDVWAAAGPQDWQERIMVTADSETGVWLADFKTIGFDITEDMRGWSSAAIYDEDGDANEGSTPPPPPNPRFGVRANVDQVEGWEWNVGETITLAIDNPGTPANPDFTDTRTVEVASWDPNQSYVYFGLWNVFDIQPGYDVSLTYGSITKTTTVTNLAFTDINLELNLVTGTAAPDSRVDIWACDNITCINRHINANGSGIWTADFGSFGDEGDEQNTFDLVPGTWIDSSQTDEDSDQTDWGERVPNPYIEAAPYSDWIHAREWLLGTAMTLNIDNPADGIGNQDVDHNPIDYSESGIMQQAPWNPGDPNDIVADFRWPDQFAPGPGYVLTMTGNGQSKTLTISGLNVTGFDLEADTISGTGSPGVQIQVCANIPNRCITRWVTPDENGNWTADYKTWAEGDDPETVDIQPGSNGWAAEFEADSDRTWFDWRVPNPYIEAAPYSDWIHAREWPLGTLMTLTIDNPADGIGDEDQDGNPVDYSETATMQQAPWNPGDPNDILADFRWPDQFAPGPGYVLTMGGDNGQSKTLIISQLNITNFDIEADVISGMGTANSQIQVCANIPNRCITRWVTADGDGNWIADYGEPGTGNDDPDTVDVQPWGNGWAAETDADADRTWFDWRVPNPYFRVFPEWEYIDGGDWPQGVTVSASVSGKPLCVASDVAEHQGGDPWNTFINMGFPAGCNIEVGDLVTITDGNTTLTHTVLDLAVTELDKVNDLVSGTAGVGAVVHVWDSFGNELDVVSDGTWQVQFETDLTEGMCVRAEIHDTPGYPWNSGTAVNPCVPNPRFIVFPEGEWFDGNDWPDGSKVDITVLNKPECTTSRVSWGYFFSGSFGEGCDVVVGDVVTFTDGETVRTHTVRNLAITSVDKQANTVAGTANVGEVVYAYVHGFGETNMQLTVEDGTWLADFGSDGFDIMEGMGGRSEIRDEFGNSTAVDWWIPNPSFTVFPEEAYLAGVNWPEGVTVSITVAGKEVCSTEAVPGFYPDWDPSHPWFYADFPEGCAIKAGDLVTLSNSSTTRTHIVGNLAVTEVNADADTVAGTAVFDPDQYILETWIHNVGGYMRLSAEDGTWLADFGSQGLNLQPGMGGRIQLTDQNSNVTAIDWNVLEPPPPSRTLEAGNFYVEWSQTNPEEVTYLSWKGSPNLASSCTAPNCPGNFEFFGNSWVSENEGMPDFFFASLVGGGTTGAWTQAGTTVDIHSVCLDCLNSADTPVHTSYQFFDEPSKANLIAITRTFEFGETLFAHAIRAVIPRLYPFDGFNQVVYRDVDGNLVVTEAICDFGCQAAGWDGNWFAIHNPTTGQGVILQRTPSTIAPALWLDWDAASFTNASNFLLFPPEGGFTGTVTETEYLCFYDGNTWTPSLTLPEGCLP